MKKPQFLIIGSGPGGTAAAHKLLQSGHSVLMIERGDFLPKEAQNRESAEVYGEKRYRTQERWQDEEGEPFRPWMHFNVGGNAKLYGAALYRFRKADFEEVIYAEGKSPAWPVDYEEMAPFYDEAEKLYHVCGDRQSDETEPTNTPYPHKAIADEPSVARLKKGLSKNEVRTLPLPLGVNQGHENEGWKTDLTKFDAYPDPSLSKSEPEASLLPLFEGKNFELRVRTEALRFNFQGDKITGLLVRTEDGEEILQADHYLCSAGAIQSAKLFLQSSPDGSFANRSGQVGRNYMAHICSAATARFEEKIHAPFAKMFGSNHWYQPDANGLLLGSIQTQGKWDATQYRLEDWSYDEGEDLSERAEHSLEFFFMTEDLPLPENRIEVTSEGQIRISRTLTNLAEHRALTGIFESELEALPHDSLTLVDFRQQLLPLAWCTHQCGTLRFGDDPQTSVLDRFCRAHDFINLTVLDGSFFPSSSALNPTLTIVANALRVGAHLS